MLGSCAYVSRGADNIYFQLAKHQFMYRIVPGVSTPIGCLQRVVGRACWHEVVRQARWQDSAVHGRLHGLVAKRDDLGEGGMTERVSKNLFAVRAGRRLLAVRAGRRLLGRRASRKLLTSRARWEVLKP